MSVPLQGKLSETIPRSFYRQVTGFSLQSLSHSNNHFEDNKTNHKKIYLDPQQLILIRLDPIDS